MEIQLTSHTCPKSFCICVLRAVGEAPALSCSLPPKRTSLVPQIPQPPEMLGGSCHGSTSSLPI